MEGLDLEGGGGFGFSGFFENALPGGGPLLDGGGGRLFINSRDDILLGLLLGLVGLGGAFLFASKGRGVVDCGAEAVREWLLLRMGFVENCTSLLRLEGGGGGANM